MYVVSKSGTVGAFGFMDTLETIASLPGDSIIFQMFLIAKHGQIYFIEANPVVSYGEIAATIIITLLAITVFILQWKRLVEKLTTAIVYKIDASKQIGKPM